MKKLGRHRLKKRRGERRVELWSVVNGESWRFVAVAAQNKPPRAVQRFTDVPIHVATLAGAENPAQIHQGSRYMRTRVLITPRKVVIKTETHFRGL